MTLKMALGADAAATAADANVDERQRQ